MLLTSDFAKVKATMSQVSVEDDWDEEDIEHIPLMINDWKHSQEPRYAFTTVEAKRIVESLENNYPGSIWYVFDNPRFIKPVLK